MASKADCIFCQIVQRDIPSTIVYQDEDVTAFEDINPQMPAHVLLVPNDHVDNTEALEAEHDLQVGRLIRTARIVAKEQGVAENGYRLVINTGRDSLNTVPHLHVHLLGGRKMGWPPG